MTLTQRAIEAAHPVDRPFELRDASLPGLILRVQPSGRKSFIIEFRAHGRKRRITIGDAAIIKVAKARRMAIAIKGRALEGHDPAEERRQAREDAKRKAEAVTLGDFLDGDYRDWYLDNRKTGHHTLTGIKRVFADILDFPLADINAWQIEKCRAETARRLGRPSAGNRELANLKAALNRAVDWQLIEDTPARRVKLNRTDKGRKRRALSDAELDALYAALRARDEEIRHAPVDFNPWLARTRTKALGDFADYLEPLVLLAIETGLRKGELLALEWRDIRDNHLVVRGETAKSAQSRTVPLTRRAADVLRRWRASSKGAGLVFPHPRTGERMTGITTAWRALRARAGLDKELGLHHLRHTCLSRLVAAGADVRTVQAWAGHQSIVTTSRYLHVDDDRLQAAARLMETK